MQPQGGGSLGQVEVTEEQSLLCRCPLQAVEHAMKFRLVEIRRFEFHAALRARPEPLFERLAHHHGPEVHEAFHGGQHIFQAEFLGQLLQLASFLGVKKLEDGPVGGVELWAVGQETGVAHNPRFALQLHPLRQCGFHHFALGTHIIMCHPLPQLQLCGKHAWPVVGHVGHLLELRCGLRVVLLQPHDDTGVETARPERHHHAAAHRHTGGEPGRNDVAETAGQGQG